MLISRVALQSTASLCVQARQAGTDTLLSLAPSTSVNHTFAVVAWHGTAAKVVAHINDAHPPETDATGVLGYVADYATADAWVAMVVDKEPSILPGKEIFHEMDAAVFANIFMHTHKITRERERERDLCATRLTMHFTLTHVQG